MMDAWGAGGCVPGKRDDGDGKLFQGSEPAPISRFLPSPPTLGFNAPGGLSRVALLPPGSCKTAAEALMHEEDARVRGEVCVGERHRGGTTVSVCGGKRGGG